MIEAAGIAADAGNAGRLVAFRDVTRVLAKGSGEAVPEAAALMEQHDMVIPAAARDAYGALHSSETTD